MNSLCIVCVSVVTEVLELVQGVSSCTFYLITMFQLIINLPGRHLLMVIEIMFIVDMKVKSIRHSTQTVCLLCNAQYSYQILKHVADIMPVNVAKEDRYLWLSYIAAVGRLEVKLLYVQV